MSTNVGIIEGRLVRDAEYSVFGTNSTPKLTFSVANNTGYGDYKRVNYFDCQIIGKKAEALAQYMVTGKPVNLVCEMQQNRWENQDGQKRSKVIFHVTDVSFTAGEKKENGSTQQRPEQGFKQPPANNSKPSAAPAAKPNPFQAALAGAKPQGQTTPDDWEDEIPF